MEITGVSVKKTKGNGKMKAVCSVTLDGELVLHDVKVIETEEKRFIAMPSRKFSDGTFADVVHPISKEFREKLEGAVISSYLAAE